MTPHEKALAFISEFGDDYILVLRVANETAVSVSDPEWAKAIMESGQVSAAIQSHEEFLRNIEAQNRKDSGRKHHGMGQNGPGTHKSDSGGDAGRDGL